jgi:hypothetical protein
MRIVWAIVILVGIGWLLSTWDTAMEERTQKEREKPRSQQYIAGNLDRGKAGAAAIDINSYKNAIIMYNVNKGIRPQSLKEVVDAGYLPGGMEHDPFGQLYELTYQDDRAKITSPGADRVRGTADDILQEFPVN